MKAWLASETGTAFTRLDHAARWSVVVPAIPAAVLIVAMVNGREKSWFGEAAAALAFAGVSVPIAMAAGASMAVGLAIAIPFALLFTTTTLAVRVVILRVRAGGDPRHPAARGDEASRAWLEPGRGLDRDDVDRDRRVVSWTNFTQERLP
jgi:hypothetical protein